MVSRRPFATLTIAKKGGVLVAIPFVAQIVFGVALLVVSRKAVEAHGWELHSQQVLNDAYSVKTSLLLTQASLRAYVLTENTDFLADCRAAQRSVPPALSGLFRLVSDNAAQRRRVQQMATSAGAVVDFQNANAGLVLNGRRPESIRWVATEAGKHLMENFLVPADAFVAEEQRLAALRHAQASKSNQSTIAIVAVGVTLNLLLAVGLAIAFISGISRRLLVLTENARRLEAQEE
ncbi:MAG TPA: CHASE3 domain-containing protein, partial [Thermoanaerobaculia bacterium]